MQDIRERVTGKERTHTHSQLTAQDVIHDDIIPNIRYKKQVSFSVFINMTILSSTTSLEVASHLFVSTFLSILHFVFDMEELLLLISPTIVVGQLTCTLIAFISSLSSYFFLLFTSSSIQCSTEDSC